MSDTRASSVTTVVVGAGGQDVLLHLRGDVHLWSLPGGGVEPGEEWEAAAVREVREETGYDIGIDRFVSEYRRPDIGDVKRVFVGHVTGGEATLRPPETIRIAWFSATRLPFNRMPWTRDYVRDALAGTDPPLATTQRQPRRVKLVIRSLYAVADLQALVLRHGQRLRDRVREPTGQD